MGFETANIHLGSRGARARIRASLRSLPPHWLHQASKLMAQALRDDWEQWRAASR